MTLIRVAEADESGTPLNEWRIEAPARIARGLLRLGRLSPTPAVVRVLIAPAGAVSARRIGPGARTSAQAAAAALVPEAGLAAAPEACLSTAGPADADGRLVAVHSREAGSLWRRTAAAAGFDPHVVIPDFAVLPVLSRGTWAAARRANDVVLRHHDRACSCDPDVAERLVAGSPVEEHDWEARVRAALLSGALGEWRLPFGEEGWGGTRAADHRAAIAAAAAAWIIVCAAPWAAAAGLSAATGRSTDEARMIARAALAEGTRIVNPRAQLAEAMSGAPSAAQQLAVTRTVLRAAGEAPGVTLQRIDARAGEGLRLVVYVRAAEDIEPYRSALASAGLAFRATEGPTIEGLMIYEIQVETP